MQITLLDYDFLGLDMDWKELDADAVRWKTGKSQLLIDLLILFLL